MPSQLRHSSSFTPSTQTPFTINQTVASLHKRQKMTLDQTYHFAHAARAKLSREAARADHDLRLLVGHANLLDGLMLDLADAEREQESWFHQSVPSIESEEPKHIQWAESLPTVTEEDSSDEEEEEDDDEDISYPRPQRPQPLRRVPSPPTIIVAAMEIDEEEDEVDDDDEDLALHRTSSRSTPGLVHESESDSDDDSMPPSPPLLQVPLDAFSPKHHALSLVDPKNLAFYGAGFDLASHDVIVY